MSVLQAACASDSSVENRRRLERTTDVIIEMFKAMQVGFSKQQFNDQGLRLQRFLAQFDGIFTLNQDTFLETHYAGPVRWSHRWYGSYLPYMRFIEEPPQAYRLMLLEPLTQDTEFVPQENYQPIYKLHGSHNWFADSKSERLLVIGGNKTGTIRAFEILNRYQQDFQNMLLQPDVHLMVIGYGFGDTHINSVIERAARDGMQTFIIDPCGVDVIDKRDARVQTTQPISNLMCALMPNLIGASRRPLNEIIFSDFIENEKVMRFFEGQPEIWRVARQ